ncbi:MAG: DUF4169 family protein [Rhizomicrobium sp.]
MAEIVNLKRARKAKARGEAERKADANRTLHGTPKAARKLARAQGEKDAQSLEAHKLAGDPDNTN